MHTLISDTYVLHISIYRTGKFPQPCSVFLGQRCFPISSHQLRTLVKLLEFSTSIGSLVGAWSVRYHLSATFQWYWEQWWGRGTCIDKATYSFACEWLCICTCIYIQEEETAEGDEAVDSQGIPVHVIWKWAPPKMGTLGPHFHMKSGTPVPMHFHNILGIPGSPFSYKIGDPSMKMGTPMQLFSLLLFAILMLHTMLETDNLHVRKRLKYT